MMPNEGRRRGRAIGGIAVALVGVVLGLLLLQASGLLAGSATAAPSVSGTVAAVSSPSGPGGIAAPPSRSALPGDPIASPSVSASAEPPGATASPSSAPPSNAASPLPVAPLTAARLQQTLDKVRSQLSIPGVSVAILWDDGRSWVGASGLRNVATQDRMTTGTAFALASISKTFTAAVVLQLVQEERLALDQSVAPLLPQYKLDKRITVRMLLDHTSGLPDYFLRQGIDAALRRAPDATWTAQQAWSYVLSKHATPGTTWFYSNTNYLLLGELVQAVTGNPLAQEVRSRLLDPLGLTTAYYQDVETPREAGTLSYVMTAKAGGGWTVKPVARPSDVMPFRSVVTAAGGAGSIAATALDVARWMRAWAGGEVLDPAMQAQMLGDVARTVKLHAAIPYGLGIQRVTLDGYTALGHSGRFIGFRNVVRYLPAAGVTIAVLTNQSAWDPSRIASALLKVILPTATPTPTPSASPH
jgi:D-alanyl-D-alanine carboxypeptidase